MKKTLRTMMLVAAGVLGSVAVAHAQQPAPPAPPPGQPAPPGQPPPADFGVAPAALPAAPVGNAPVPSVSWGNQPPPADSSTTTPAPAPAKKANPFLLTRLDWTNTATTSIFGIGQDQQSSDGQSYTMDFLLRVRYAPIADSTKRFFIQAALGWGAELTNSDSTTKRNQWQLRDMSVGLGYQHNVYKSDSGVSTTPLVSASMILPTSPQSQGTGRYGTLSLSGGLMQALPLVPKSDWISDIFLIGVAGYSHVFSRSYTAANDIVAIQRPRTGPDGNVAFSDQLSGGAIAADNARLLAAAYLTIYKDLSLNGSLELLLPFKRQFSGTDVTLPTGTVHLDPSKTALIPATTFDVGFSYTLFNMTRIDLGYQHSTTQLRDDGKRRSLFYGPDAAFYTNVSVFLDSILDKAFNLTGGPTARRAAKAAAQHGGF